MMLDDRMQREIELDGFDPDLVGFDCAGWLEPTDPPDCPWQPGCGRTVHQCPLKARLMQIARAPQRMQ